MFTRKLALLALSSLFLPLFVVGCGGGGSGSDSGLAPAESGLPQLVEAQALSNHYVEVGFAGAAGDDAGDPGNYVITDPGGASLTVSAVRLSCGVVRGVQ